jgi:polyribonucleotide 5'-hydroxyl-kinase
MEHALHPEHELRVEVPRGRTCVLRVVSGLCEVFGTELSGGAADPPPSGGSSGGGSSSSSSSSVVYRFEGPASFAVFTWYKDCVVELSGVAADAAYMTDDSQMKAYASVHGRLNWKRDEARRVGADGPRVLVCGPGDCGKSTLARVLLSYAVRAGYAPTFVELDVGQGSLSVPGTVGAAALSPREITADRGVTAARPLVYWYGESAPDDAGERGRYGSVVGALAAAVDERTGNDEALRASGLVINTGGRVDDGGLRMILEAVRAFSVELVLVIGDDRLHNRIGKELKAQRALHRGPRLASTAELIAVKLPRSGGAVDRSAADRKAARAAAVARYFYGLPSRDITLAPCEHHLSFSDVDIFAFEHPASGSIVDSGLTSLGGGSGADADLVAASGGGGGGGGDKDSMRVVRLDVDKALVHSILAVVHAPSLGGAIAGDDAVGTSMALSSVAGFVSVKAVNMDTRTITVLSPASAALPSRTLLKGSLTWLDQ